MLIMMQSILKKLEISFFLFLFLILYFADGPLRIIWQPQTIHSAIMFLFPL